MIFNKTFDNVFAAIFNIFQGATMTLSVSAFMGKMEVPGLIKTFVCAYCAGVMLMMFLRVPAFGDLMAKVFRCKGKKYAEYLVSNVFAGMLMGIFMNFFMTFMILGPVPEFVGAFFHTLLFSIGVSAVSSTVWIGVTGVITGRIMGKEH